MTVINTNMSSLSAQSKLYDSGRAQSTAMERLSSGKRINSAKDDAAGKAIADLFNRQYKAGVQGIRNAGDGVSMVQSAEGKVSKMTNNLDRMRQLAQQALSQTNSARNVAALNVEFQQQKAEIARNISTGDFNGVKMFEKDMGLKIQVGSRDGETIDVQMKELNLKVLGIEDFELSKNEIAKVGDAITTVSAAGAGAPVRPNLAGLAAQIGDTTGATLHKLLNAGGTESDRYVVKHGENLYAVDSVDAATGAITLSTQTVTGSASAAALVRVGVDSATGNNVAVFEHKGELKTANLDLAATTPTTAIADDAAADALATVELRGMIDPLARLDKAIDLIADLTNGFGAFLNRMEATIDTLRVDNINLKSAASRIEDADFAEETSANTRAQILQSAGITMLAQANQSQQAFLKLLG